MDDFETELKIGFLEEATQALADTEQCFLSLESDPNNAENLNKIFRLAHNLKGSSKAVGFNEMGDFTHHFESFILKIKNGELEATAPVINILLQGNDHLTKMALGLKADLNGSFDSTALLEQMAQMSGPQPTAPPTTSTGESTDTIDFVFSDPPQAESSGHHAGPETDADPNSDSSAITSSNATNPTAEDFDLPQTQQPNILASVPPLPLKNVTGNAGAANNSSGNSPAKKQAPVDESIRISLSKLESLLNFVGEMVILQSVMQEQVSKTDSLLMKKTVHQLGKVGKEIQDISMSLRMIPVKQTFQKMQRIVRDTAQATNKDVTIVLRGEETELDKTVLEKINDPLVHLIRNSVDHGIEDSQTRLARGKNAKGQIILSAHHESGKLIIDVIDDGGGLDTAKLKKIAIAKGILNPNTELSEQDAFNLIFAPGFSTKETVTDVSGRGVGMDVVRTNVLDLHGDISIESVLGKGTTIRISLPLTLAIVQAMILTYGHEKYVIPLNHIHETVRPSAKQLQKTTGLGDILLLRGENIPIFRLGDYFNKKSALESTDMIALVIRSGRTTFALLVDDIIGQFQVVIKQLGPELQGFKGVSGSTILGDGKPALILEPLDLIKRKLILSTPTQLAPTTNVSQVTAGGHAA